MVNDPRIKIITGHFGSGKTELAINLSLNARIQYEKVALSDLDVVNPYFRSREVSSLLEERGIELIAPKGKLATSDLPIVSGEIYRVIYAENYRLIIDVGGDKDGATALGQYYNDLKKQDYQMYFVVNANRPYVSTVEGITKITKEIELTSRLKVSALINNTNLGAETSLADIEKGYEITLAASKALDIPFIYTTISKQLENETSDFANKYNVLYIERFMKLPWD